MPSTHLASSSLPDKLREGININGPFTKLEDSKLEEPDMLELESSVPTGISHARQQRFSSMCLDKEMMETDAPSVHRGNTEGSNQVPITGGR